MNLIETVMHQSGASAPGSGNGWISFLLIGGFVAVFYFLLIRPQSKQRKRHQELLTSLSRGDEVIMASGMMGVITRVDEDSVMVKVAQNTELRFQKQAVNATLPKGTIQNVDG